MVDHSCSWALYNFSEHIVAEKEYSIHVQLYKHWVIGQFIMSTRTTTSIPCSQLHQGLPWPILTPPAPMSNTWAAWMVLLRQPYTSPKENAIVTCEDFWTRWMSQNIFYPNGHAFWLTCSYNFMELWQRAVLHVCWRLSGSTLPSLSLLS